MDQLQLKKAQLDVLVEKNDSEENLAELKTKMMEIENEIVCKKSFINNLSEQLTGISEEIKTNQQNLSAVLQNKADKEKQLIEFTKQYGY